MDHKKRIVQLLGISFESGERVDLLETEDNVQYTQVLLDQDRSAETHPHIERIGGEDGAGTKIYIDFLYDETEDQDTIKEIYLRRGYTKSLVGSLTRVIA